MQVMTKLFHRYVHTQTSSRVQGLRILSVLTILGGLFIMKISTDTEHS